MKDGKRTIAKRLCSDDLPASRTFNQIALAGLVPTSFCPGTFTSWPRDAVWLLSECSRDDRGNPRRDGIGRQARGSPGECKAGLRAASKQMFGAGMGSVGARQRALAAHRFRPPRPAAHREAAEANARARSAPRDSAQAAEIQTPTTTRRTLNDGVRNIDVDLEGWLMRASRTLKPHSAATETRWMGNPCEG